MTKVRAFFVFFIEGMNSIDMKIPRGFTQAMEKPFSKEVLLRNRHHKLWIVKVVKVGEDWYFVDGWDKFVDENMLTSLDLMVFEYFSEDLFDVKVYGRCGTEKNGNCKSEDNVVNESSSIGGFEDTESEDDDVLRSQIGEDEEEDVDSDNIIRVNEGKRVVTGSNVKHDRDNIVVGGDSKEERMLYLYPKCYGMDIFEAGLAQQPTNPYFVAKIMPKRKSDLFIPQDVIKDNNLKLGAEIILVDPSGREFRSKCRKWKDGRSIVSGGWVRLCRVNRVKSDHHCICEFVEREGDPRHFLCVNIVRSTSNV